MVIAQRDLIQRISVFGALSAEALDFLLQRTTRVTREGRSCFFREGDQARSIYVIESGRVAILKNWENREYLLRTLGPADCFGEMALMEMYPRSATALAVIDSTAFELDSAALLELYQLDIEQFTLLQMNLGREVSRRLRDANDKMFRRSVAGDAEKGDRILPQFEPWYAPE